MNVLRFGSRCLRAPSLGALAIFAIVCCLVLAANASAQTREHTLRWVQSEGPEPSGYLTYLGAEPGVYSEVLDLGPVDPDPDGTRRATLILDAYTTYYIAISAYNDLGESPLSDEVFSPSDACLSLLCDDGNPCTADDCIADGCIHTPLLGWCLVRPRRWGLRALLRRPSASRWIASSMPTVTMETPATASRPARRMDSAFPDPRSPAVSQPSVRLLPAIRCSVACCSRWPTDHPARMATG